MMEESRMKNLELLSPAKDKETAKQAILHGADAVYMGASAFGARKSASNTLDDIAETVDFAHQFHSKLYVTFNTIIFENELKPAEFLIRDLYHLGVDALIIQDMGILRMHIPPIALHASTQCDIRTPEKAEFLEKVGFSQIVLARELTLPEIKEITTSVTIPVECFIHGALCVSYSGRCGASCYLSGRSANRGECSQVCRLPFTLKDASGKTLQKDKYLLSLKDFNASGNLESLIEAGVSSFKIEGRLKDTAYVKNITSFYNRKLNQYIEKNEGRFKRSSFGNVTYTFTPEPSKSFNRGFTSYFLGDRSPSSIASLKTPKSMGEEIKDLRMLKNGDGISYFDRQGVYKGANINAIKNDGVITSDKSFISKDVKIFRTNDLEWNKIMSRDSAKRKLALTVEIDLKGISGKDQMGNFVRLPWGYEVENTEKLFDFRKEFEKLGNTHFVLKDFEDKLGKNKFIPLSIISSLRRTLVDKLVSANKISYPFEYRRKEDIRATYPDLKLEHTDNVANSLSGQFYREHGVGKIDKAFELLPSELKNDKRVMLTRHCILRELGKCKKYSKHKLHEPLVLQNGSREFKLKFNCKNCEMEVWS